MKLIKKVTKKIKELVYSSEFKAFTRKRPSDFTRKGKLPFEELILFTIKNKKGTMNNALRKHFKELDKDISMKQSSLTEARAKLKPRGLQSLFQEATVIPMIEAGKRTWNGFFVYAVDGTKVALPADEKLLVHYGAVGRGATSPTAQASLICDVLNDIVIDATINPIAVDERTLALQHIDQRLSLIEHCLKLIIFDRGYPSFELIKVLEAKGLNYVMRVKKKFNLDIDAQIDADGIVTLEQDGKSINVRVIKVELDSGEIETLITNIWDETLSAEDFKVLYFLRWPVETKYNTVKNKLELEDFTARTVEGIQIDFFATMTMTNILACLEFDANEEIVRERKDKDNKYQYKANKNELIGILKDHFVIALAHPASRKRKKAINDIIKQAKQYVIPIRPDRTVERNPNPRDAKFHFNQKSNA